MQNIIKKEKIELKPEINLENNKETNKLSKNDLLFLYKGNSKSLIGLEYERLSLDNKTFKNAPYSKVKKIIENFSKILSWEIIYDDDTIIATCAKNGTTISLEPGMQLEISVAPKKNILDIDIELSKIINLLDKIAKIYDVIFLGYGISPNSSVDEIEILNKKRYKIMNDYLPYCSKAEFCPKMMRQTAGIQINIDYQNNLDAFLKLKFLNLIMPFMTALCSNSPFEKNKLTENKSQRANVWLYTGENRCNFFYKEIFNSFLATKNIFKNYINEILKVPMLYIERNNENILLNGKINFETFLKEGYQGYFATTEDYILHQSLIFPDIRLKNYIEIRNHDSSNPAMALALCAFYKGLMKNDISSLIEKFNFLKINNADKYSKQIISKGLDINVNQNITGWQIVDKLFKLSVSKLNAKDSIYLKPIKEILQLRKTQADTIIDYDIKDTKSLVEFLT